MPNPTRTWVNQANVAFSNQTDMDVQYTEAIFALEGQSPNRIMLNVDRVMRTDYVIDDLQPTYFVIESFEDLYRQTVERDFDRLFLQLMIRHHEGAVTMVEELLDQPGAAYDPVLFEFTNDVTNDQTAEIERMSALLAGLSEDPRTGLAWGFDDAGEAMFGSHGVTTMLHKTTIYLAIAFMVTSLGLVYLTAQRTDHGAGPARATGARQVLAAAAAGKRFLFRSAASLLTALAGLPRQPVAAADMAAFVRAGRPGVVLVGSHVDKSSRQLQVLLDSTSVTPLHVDLDRLDDDADRLFGKLVDGLNAAQRDGCGAVLYTSRGERVFASSAERLAFGERVSGFLMRLVQALPAETGFLISKGGIISNDTLGVGLALRTARVVGQVHAGCSVVVCPDDHPRFPRLPVVIFPGNVGGDDAVAAVGPFGQAVVSPPSDSPRPR